jgi:hypothetical protein
MGMSSKVLEFTPSARVSDETYLDDGGCTVPLKEDEA